MNMSSPSIEHKSINNSIICNFAVNINNNPLMSNLNVNTPNNHSDTNNLFTIFSDNNGFNFFLKERNINTSFPNIGELDESLHLEKKIMFHTKITQLGRKKRKDSNLNSNINNIVHKRDSKDNIYKKIKRFFFESIREWINLNLEKNCQLVKSNTEINYNCKNEDIKIFNNTFKEIFSRKISKKFFKSRSENYNELTINQIYKSNNLLAIKKLDLTFKEGMEIFSNCGLTQEIEEKIFNKDEYSLLSKKDKEKKIQFFLEGFRNKKDFIRKIKTKDNSKENNDYIEKIDDLCKNLEQYLGSRHRKK